jgi:C-terminal processing protease CtpA/Prc
MALVTRLSKKDSGSIIYWNGKNFAETEKKHGFSKWFNLDYTNYFGPRRHLKIAGRSQQDTSLTAITPECFGANRCGILGIWYDKKRCLTRLMDGLPAQRAGLKVGDQLIAVDTVPVDGMTDRELSNRIAGLIDSSVKLTLQRDGRKFESTMKRQYPVSEEDLSKKE